MEENVCRGKISSVRRYEIQLPQEKISTSARNFQSAPWGCKMRGDAFNGKKFVFVN